jgi:hypothetical protein
VLLALGGPLAAWQVARALWPIRWTVALLWVATEWCFYAFYFRRTYEEFNKIPADCKPKGAQLALLLLLLCAVYIYSTYAI